MCRPRRSSPSTRTSRPTPTQLASSTRAQYVETMIERFGLGASELGRRDRQQRRLPAAALRRAGDAGPGIEPARNVATVASSSGMPTLVAFFGRRRARASSSRDGTAGRPDRRQQRPRAGAGPERLRRGIEALLAPSGVVTMEFPHLLRLIEGNQFDTIYHEHFSYFSLATGDARSSRAHGLDGRSTSRSCRHTAARCASTPGTTRTASARRPAVGAILERARIAAGLDRLDDLRRVRRAGEETKRELLDVPDRREARTASRSPATARRARATRC